jgi:hypothetical protein
MVRGTPRGNTASSDGTRRCSSVIVVGGDPLPQARSNRSSSHTTRECLLVGAKLTSRRLEFHTGGVEDVAIDQVDFGQHVGKMPSDAQVVLITALLIGLERIVGDVELVRGKQPFRRARAPCRPRG